MSISLFDPRLWLAVVVWTALASGLAYLKGGKDERAETIAAQAKAAAEARETEHELQRINNRDTAAYVGRVRKQEERAHALPKIIIDNDCTVPADAGRVLNDAQRVPDDAGDRSGAGTASEAVDSTCAAELDIAKRNYAEVCIPNAEQLKELQARWEKTRARINRGQSKGESP